MNALRKFFDRWLFEEYRVDVESLAIFRIVFSAYVLLTEFPLGLWSLPRAAYSAPMSLAALFTDYPPHSVMLALNVVTMACASSLLIGFRCRASSLGLALGTVLIGSFAYADGKIDESLVPWIALVLAPSGWGDAFAVDARRRPARPNGELENASLLALLALLVGFALFTAGSAKAHGGWLRPDTLGTRYHLFWDYFVYDRKTPLATWAWQHLPRWAWKAGDYSTVVWESTFVLTAFRRSWCRVACAIGVLFHFGVWQLFDIRIAGNVVAYGAFVTWSRVWPRGTEALRAFSARQLGGLEPLLLGLPFVFSACSLFVFGAAGNAAFALVSSTGVLCVGLLFAAAYLTLRVRSQRSGVRDQ